MMTKNSFIRRLLLMGALLVAVTASADSYFFIDDPQFKPSDFGQQITLPVKACFDKDVSSWDVQFMFPEGLTPVSIANGSDMTFDYLDSRGRIKQVTFTIVHNSDLTHFVSSTSIFRGYDEEGEFDYGDLKKWEAGIHDEMFLITFMVDYDFYGGDIQVYTQTSCGNDMSGNITPDPSVTGFVPESDADGDGSITVNDIVTIMNYLATGEEWWDGYSEILYGDVNQDSNVNIVDVEMLCDLLFFDEWFQGYELNEAHTQSPVTSIINMPTEVLFYIDPLELTADDLDQDITIPVKANFEGYTSSWDVQFTFPDGLTPVGYAPGSDMKLTTMTNTGNLITNNAYCLHNEEYTHFVASTMCSDYQDDGFGDYELRGTAKWIPGDYQEMFLLTIHVSEDFEGGEINVLSKSTCGWDISDDAPTLWPETMNYNQYLPGDVNCDGIINVDDVTDLMLYLSGYTTDIYDTCADVHTDGVIDLLDLEKLIDYIFYGEWSEGYVLNESEEYSVPAIIDFPPVIAPGDMNGDGEINVSDVIDLINELLNNEHGIDNPSADYNCDGEVNIIDIIDLINFILNN